MRDVVVENEGVGIVLLKLGVATGDGGRPPTAPMALASSTSVWAAVVTGTGLVAVVVFAAQVVSMLIVNCIYELNGQVRSV